MASPREMLENIETATSIAPRNGGLELNEWETNFVNSVTEEMDNGGQLSKRQMEKLAEIWDRT